MNDKYYLTPDQIIRFPELAALQILRTSTTVARVALLARYPSLRESSWVHPRNEKKIYATMILDRINILEAMLGQYLDIVQQHWQQQNQEAVDLSS